MMYSGLRRLLLRVLAAPSGPPEAPAGSPGSVMVFRASKRFLVLRAVHVAIVGFITAAPELVGLVAAVINESWWQIFALSVVLAIALWFTYMHWFVVRLDYDMRHYVVTDRSLRIREGALVIRESTFTFANVQNVSVHQGPLERLLGMASVRVETAGGGGSSSTEKSAAFAGHRGNLAGIDNAEEVRDRILSLLRAYRDAGLGDHDDRRAHDISGVRLSAVALERLREVRDEARKLGAALSA